MNTTRKQLFPAIAMLLVAAIALGTATYAWFVNNATANVETMNFQASTSTYLQVALANGGTWNGVDVPSGFDAPDEDTDWRGLISTDEIKTLYNLAQASSFRPLMPASTGKQVKKFFSVDETNGWDLETSKATTFAAIQNFRPTVGGIMTNSDVLVIPLYLRSSSDMPVYLNDAVDLITGEAISGSIRVAIVPDSNVTGSAVTNIFEDSSTKAPGRGNTTAKITAGEDQGIIDTDGTVEQQGAKPWSTFEVTEKDGFADSTNGKTALFTLEKDKPALITVYVWMEGCDFDCVSSVANQEFNVNLSFIGKKPDA